MAIEVFSAEVTSVSGLKVIGKTRDFEIIMDEPKESGGTNQGMNPVELLLNSLGGCLVIVIKAFGRAKGMKINSVTVKLAGELDPDGFSYKNPNAKKGFSKITCEYLIDADNTEEEIVDFIHFVEETCPVHDTIEHAPEFVTTIHKV